LNKARQIACVTGASGMIGSKIVKRLVSYGYRVRILSRSENNFDQNVELYRGGLEDEETLKSFLNHAHLLFHCAAELHNPAKMWVINVVGTQRILDLIQNSDITYMCYLSSAGVIGSTDSKLVDEESECDPINFYEKSKWAAEKIVSKGTDRCTTVILGPTDVIDEKRPGALALPVNGRWIDQLVVFLKGGECAHIVHADDVADAAMFFINTRFDRPERFFVSCDHEQFNTFGGLWSLYHAIDQEQPIDNIKPLPHLPIIVPYLMRRLWRGSCSYGNVRYSSERLLSKGFHYRLGVEGAVRRIVNAQHLNC